MGKGKRGNGVLKPDSAGRRQALLDLDITSLSTRFG
jgi:hypothetical protein